MLENQPEIQIVDLGIRAGKIPFQFNTIAEDLNHFSEWVKRGKRNVLPGGILEVLVVLEQRAVLTHWTC